MTALPPAAPSPDVVPQHYFRTLCQNTKCRKALGGFHIPHVGGSVLFACHRCNLVSVFRVEQFGISAHLVDQNGRVIASVSQIPNGT